MLPTSLLRRKPTYLEVAEELRRNRGQWAAYESGGNCVILAGPGSGKTKTVTIKVARMLHEDVQEPRGLACITYNNECVRELRRRFERLGVSDCPNLFVGTVHSFSLTKIVIPFARLAGLELPLPLSVATAHEQERAFEEALDEVVGLGENIRNWRVRADRYRRTYLDRSSPEWQTDPTVSSLIEAYERRLRKNGQIDFDDMVLIGLRLIEGYAWVRKIIQAKFPILVVDEYQDLGLPLHRMVIGLLSSGARLIAVGDPDQSIYGFTGARPELLHVLAGRDDVKAVRLSTNYRCGKAIVEAGKVALGEDREYDTPQGSHEGRIVIHYCPDGLPQQARTICEQIVPKALKEGSRCLGDIAVLYPTRFVGDDIAEEAKAHGYPFIRIDENAPYRKTPLTRWLEDCAEWCSGGWRKGRPSLSGLVRTWLGFNQDEADDDRLGMLRQMLVAFLWMNRDSRRDLHQWLSEFEASCLNEALDKQGAMREERNVFKRLLQACSEDGPLKDFTIAAFAGQRGARDHLTLITLHSAKGTEFDVVAIMGLDQGVLPRYDATELGKKEWRRLFYVGLTRARHEVHLTYSGWRTGRGKSRISDGPSEFLTELEERLTIEGGEQ